MGAESQRHGLPTNLMVHKRREGFSESGEGEFMEESREVFLTLSVLGPG